MILSAIIPAYQEAATIEPCLRALLDQTILDDPSSRVEAIIYANGCLDGTAEVARALEPLARARGLGWTVVDDPVGGKSRAINRADRIAQGDIRVYLDADVVCAPTLFAELARALEGDAPLYASGTLTIPRPRSLTSRAYARIWTRLPFVASDVAGCGLYAVNRAGRRRWGDFPELHSDDKFVRLLFAPDERRRVEASYAWPLPDGLANLLRVRRRWCEGNAELRDAFPELHAAGRPGSLREYARLVAEAPVSAAVFSALYAGGALLAAQHARATPVKWRRGR